MSDEPRRLKKKKKRPQAQSVKTHAYDTPKFLDVRGKNPELRYRWVAKEGNNIFRREDQGWRVCDSDSLKGARHQGSSNLESHDLILMETDVENHAMLRAAPGARSRRRIEGSLAPKGHESLQTTKITTGDLPTTPDEDTIFE